MGDKLRLRFKFTARDQERIENWRDRADRALLWSLQAAFWTALAGALWWAGLPLHSVVSGVCMGVISSAWYQRRKENAADGGAVDIQLDLDDAGLELRCGDLTISKAWQEIPWGLLTPDGVLLRLKKAALAGIYVPPLKPAQQNSFEALLRRRLQRVRRIGPPPAESHLAGR